ncbi:hypothetical protein BDV35DRAFT_350758 [Aspergillus flavus]|uniref:Uncharacterized protein n=1 Tax=Aspergillus flavus TaxID=5059 RepID=A0A5N6H2V7_ASPFL|nr:hypothetical protein BDV35DRAFT_350758 [Aspergillus flavus]
MAAQMGRYKTRRCRNHMFFAIVTCSFSLSAFQYPNIFISRPWWVKILKWITDPITT